MFRCQERHSMNAHNVQVMEGLVLRQRDERWITVSQKEREKETVRDQA